MYSIQLSIRVRNFHPHCGISFHSPQKPICLYVMMVEILKIYMFKDMNIVAWATVPILNNMCTSVKWLLLYLFYPTKRLLRTMITITIISNCNNNNNNNNNNNATAADIHCSDIMFQTNKHLNCDSVVFDSVVVLKP